MKKTRTAISLISIIVMVPMIVALWDRLPMDRQPLIEKKYGGWSGVLRLWINQGWQVGGNLAAWLNPCIESFEKAHPGVYIQPEYVEASAMAAIGEDNMQPPDLALYPAGRMADPVNSARPVLLGGYLWAFNRNIIDRIPDTWRNVDMPIGCPPDDDDHCWSVALLALCSGRFENGESRAESAVPGGLDLGLGEIVQPTTAPTTAPIADGPCCQLPEGFAFSENAYTDFVNGDLAAIPVTQREVRRLQALSEQGKGVDWQLGASGAAFTDQVMVIRAINDQADERSELCRAFIDHLCSDACQCTLSRIGAFSATGVPSGYSAADPLCLMDEWLRRPDRVMPNPEGSGWRYSAEPIVREFLSGSGDSAVLWRRLAQELGQKTEH